MKIIKVKNYEELSAVAANIIKDVINKTEAPTLGLATGSTPLGLYKNLIEKYNNQEISFDKVKTFNLDEYCDLPREHPESYYTFMHEKLFNFVNIKEANINLPKATGDDLNKLSNDYNQLLKENKIDLQILGIGGNGHIGFNEPGTSFDQEVFVVELAQKTREDNARFFSSIDEVPTHAITMGIKNIMDAKQILMLISGKNKAEAAKKLIEGELSEKFPASILKKHSDVIVILDEEASSLLAE